MFLENGENKIFIDLENLKTILNKYTAKLIYSSNEYDLFMIEPSGNVRVNFDNMWITVFKLNHPTLFPYNLIINKDDLEKYIYEYLE